MQTNRDTTGTGPAPGGEPDWEIIDGYSRAEAIEDGVLVQAPDDAAAEAGFTCPVALTSAAWSDCVAWDDSDNQRKKTVQDETGRLWDVLWMAARAARSARLRSGNITFTVYRVPRPGSGTRPRQASLVVCAGPGDSGEPVITIMRPGED